VLNVDSTSETYTNEKCHDLYSSPSVIRVIKSRRMRWTGHAALMGVMRVVYTALVRRHEGKRPLGRPTRRGEDNIEMEVRLVGRTWTGFIWLRIGTSGVLF
jgi:hypothetical protein